ncbi:MAG TPA: hypothetical protein VGH33_09405 [Isosphaeraceae bacterium]|jgi:hypothetical protein
MLKPSLHEDPAFPSSGAIASKGFVLGLVVGALALGCALWLLRPNSAQSKPALSSPEGNLEVSYMVQESPSTASGSTLTGVTSIEFYPGYIVVTTKSGAGRTFFAEKTNKLDWRWSEPSASGRASR